MIGCMAETDRRHGGGRETDMLNSMRLYRDIFSKDWAAPVGVSTISVAPRRTDHDFWALLRMGMC